MKIDQLKIMKKISRGGSGIVYVVYDKETDMKYALKISKWDERLMRKYLPGEIEFNEKVVKKYPDFFIQLKAYEILDDCKLFHKKNYARNLFEIEEREAKNEYFANTYYSPLCIKKVYTLVDGTLSHIFHELSEEAKIAISIQLMYVFYIMLFERKIQTDTNDGNIGYKKTDKKYIDLHVKNKTYRLNTFGYLVQILDTDTIYDAENESNEDLIEYFILLFPSVYLDTLKINSNNIGKYKNISDLMEMVLEKLIS